MRAADIFKELNDKISAFIATEPFKLVGSTEHISGSYILTCEAIELPPPECSVLVSEIVHHLRSCLDNIAYLIAKQNPGPNFREKGIAWPIAERMADFHNAAWRKNLDMFSDSDRDQIMALKPAGDGLRLFWKLHTLSAIDKHRMVLSPVLEMLHPGITDMRFKDCDDKVFAETWIAPPPWKVGMVVARAKDGTMSMSGGEHVIISNSELVKGEEVMRLLKHLAMLVKMVTELFVFRHENPGCSGELPEKYFEPSFGK